MLGSAWLGSVLCWNPEEAGCGWLTCNDQRVAKSLRIKSANSHCEELQIPSENGNSDAGSLDKPGCRVDYLMREM